MSINIRTADLSADRQIMMQVLRRNRERYAADEILEKRFDWLYNKNPHGKAVVWLAVDESKDEVIGFTSAFPREMTVNGKCVRAWNCADFSIDRAYRTLGVAIKLRKAAKTGVDSGEMEFLYAHPNDRMRVIHERVGHHLIGNMRRYAALLGVQRILENRFGRHALTAGLARVGNPLLRTLQKRPRLHADSWSAELLCPAQFDSRFGALYARVANRFGVSGVRDATYLNWRYAGNPLERYEVLTLSQGTLLAGYVIFTENDGTGHIVDLLVEPGEAGLEHLLAALFQHLRARNISTLSVKLHDRNPLLTPLRTFGFRDRDDATSSVVAYAPAEGPHTATILDRTKWFMTVGDRDV